MSLVITAACFWWTFRHLFDLAEQHVLGGSQVTLVTRAPADLDGLAYQVAQTGGPSVALSHTETGFTFTAPGDAATQTLRFTLSVGGGPPRPFQVVVAPAQGAAPREVSVPVRDTNWDQMWLSVRSANYLWLLPYLLILTGIHLCRAARWGNLLSPFEKISFRKLNEASAIGFMMLIVLPFRLGEFARPFLIAQRSSVRRSPAMLTVVLERIADGLIIAVLLRVLMLFVPGDTPDIRYIKWGANLMFAVFGGGFLFLVFAAWQHERAVKLMKATFGAISTRLGDKVAHVVDGFVGAFKQLPSPGQMASFVAFTTGYWVLNGYGMSLLANAFDCTTGTGALVCQPIHLTVMQGYVMLTVLVCGLMIPAAPGSAGTFQAAVVLAMSVFLPASVVNTSGVAYANVLWLVQIVQQVTFGLIFLLLGNQSFKDLAGKLSEEARADNATS